MFTDSANQYIKNILTMMSGVFLSQVVLFLGSLLLTRIFSPDHFGIAAFYLSIANILTVASTLRFEHSIILPKNDSDSYDSMIITKRIVIAFSVIIFSLILVLNDFLIDYLSKPQLEGWLYFLPLIILFNAFFYIYRSWLVRIKKFKRISVGAIIKSIVLTIALIVGGYIYNNAVIFLIANIVAQLIETIYLSLIIKKKEYDSINAKEKLKEYNNFPRYSLPADLINTYTSQNPIIMFSFFFGDYVVGQFSLTQRVLGLPIKFISGSTLEVFKQKAAEDYNNEGNCQRIFISTFKTLFLIAIIPTLIMYFIAPFLFTFMFGHDWVEAGIYCKYLLIMFFLQFSVSPLSYTLYIAGKQNYNLYWQIGLLIITSLGIYLGVHYNSPDISILGFSITYSLMYVVYFFMIYNCSKGE